VTQKKKRKAKKNTCPCNVCGQDLRDKPRDGWEGMDCPLCGQGLSSKEHVKQTLQDAWLYTPVTIISKE